MIASLLHLNRRDAVTLKIGDPYSLHRVVYGLFDNTQDKVAAKAETSRTVLYADKGGDLRGRQILILSDRVPLDASHGQIESRPVPDKFLEHEHYRFEVTVNPTRRNKESRKLVAVRGHDSVVDWFVDRGQQQWGFSVHSPSLMVKNLSVKQFDKKGDRVTLGSATLQGGLTVVDRKKFRRSFCRGIGRGRAFGFGLLQIVPIPIY
jgi:CRISPR system Cascade subunit CasE|tara:strand:- start:1057 stop:1674 length:618 start_codon:yes stop_codon:yes gene_type:complete